MWNLGERDFQINVEHFQMFTYYTLRSKTLMESQQQRSATVRHRLLQMQQPVLAFAFSGAGQAVAVLAELKYLHTTQLAKEYS